MLVYAGIDEAGYGPLLGPLCVGCSVFIVNDADPAAGAPNLWRLLDGAVCRSRRDAKNRIAIEDSKKLKGSNASATSHPLKHLERGVLAMLSASHGAAARLPASDDELFSMLNAADQDGASPWCDVRCELPVAQVADELAIASGRIQRAMERAGVSCCMMRCEAIDAAAFNAQVARTNNKATVNFGAAMRLVEIIRQRWPREHPRIILDRHGGRTHYREELQFSWPHAKIQILAEDDRMSRYRLDCEGALLTLTFMPDAEEAHLPVALASMTAKYVRELHMLRLNRFFGGLVPELKPTAGYYTDAKRYLEAIEPAIRRLNIPVERLVRAM